MRVLVDLAGIIRAAHGAVAADYAVAGSSLKINPNLVRIHGALGKRMADVQRADYHFNEVRLAGPKFRHFGAQRRMELVVDIAAFAQAKQINADLLVSQKLALGFGRLDKLV